MKIQFNADKNITISEELRTSLTAKMSDELSRFDNHVSRLEVHLSDEDGKKDTLNDKRCMIEARIEGLQPIAVTNNAVSVEQAVAGAIDKIKSSLNTITGRLKNH
ncbi:MAG: HPF/RaiA family ribosome-associated protein [Candidatus Kapabacteria bacterium]|nr:HPF/RaiA family ribosome-associated protein [Candidatus Kapabacteria bacterium]